MTPVDITEKSDECAVVLLVSFGETVKTVAGEIEPSAAGFTLVPSSDRKPRRYATAAPSVRALRGITRKAP